MPELAMTSLWSSSPRQRVASDRYSFLMFSKCRIELKGINNVVTGWFFNQSQPRHLPHWGKGTGTLFPLSREE